MAAPFQRLYKESFDFRQKYSYYVLFKPVTSQPEKYIFMQEIRHFVTQFFLYFEADVDRDGERLLVELPENLQEYFKQERLRIAFHPHHLTDDAELATHGSYLLNRISEYMRDHGLATYAELPKNYTDRTKIPSELDFPNVIIEKARTRSGSKYGFVFNFKLDYVSDEKVGRLYSLGIDAEGNLWDPPSLEMEPAEPSHIPSADLHEAYEKALWHVEEHVKRQSVEIEKDILQRLFRQISRLDVFYTEQIEELSSRRSGRGLQDVQDRIDHLQQEFQLKVAEETENHRLRVKISLISYQTWKIPYLNYALTLRPDSDDPAAEPTEREISLERDLFDGDLEPVHCAVCHDPVLTVLMCHNGHLTCDDHTHQCVECGRWECTECGIGKCGECGALVCSSCGRKCQICGKRLCPTHLLTCHIDADPVCQTCSSICKDCEQVACPHHVERCATCRQPACQKCVKECSFCYSPICQEHTFKCEVCGQIFCTNCIRTCHVCGKRVCRSHSWECQQCGKSFCLNEREEQGAACVVQDEEICVDCQKICDVCGNVVCATHSIDCEKCQKTICQNDTVTCYECRSVLCPTHHTVCQSCSHHVCDDHTTTCQICEEVYCTRCVDPKGRCPNCQQLRFIQPIGLPTPVKQAKVPAIYKKCDNWRAISSKKHHIFLGFKNKDAFIVVLSKSGELVRHRQEAFARIMQIMMNYS